MLIPSHFSLTCLYIFLLIKNPCVKSSSQQFLSHPKSDQSPAALSNDETSNLVFDSVASLLQQWANTRYRNGHTIVKGEIPIGTVLYHGRKDNTVPLEPEWLATNVEHSYGFCLEDCWVLSLRVKEPLNVLYFDGSSAANSLRGHFDTQDLLYYGKIRPDKVLAERERIKLYCDWGKEFGIDAVVRMEMGFEVMLCDFRGKKVKVVSMARLMSFDEEPEEPPRPPSEPHLSDSVDILGYRQLLRQGLNDTSEINIVNAVPPMPGLPPGPYPPPQPVPRRWSGSIRDFTSVVMEAVQAGGWNNRYPGEVRIKLDYTRLLSFYDPAFESLVEARRGVDRSEHRLGNISHHDLQSATSMFREDLRRSAEERGSGVDWGSFTRIVVDRYGERLEYLKNALNSSDFSHENVTDVTSRVRQSVFVMLTPYMLYGILPDGTAGDRTWVKPIATQCAATLTSGIDKTTLRRSEITIYNAIEGVLTKICTVLADIWVDAMAVESATKEEAIVLVKIWKREVDELVRWLDWPGWVRCRPRCPDDSFCYLPTWPWGVGWKDDGPINMTPRCESRSNGYLGSF